jgi:predicted outer membrane repeat protein
MFNGSSSNPNLTNVTFNGNSATNAGGGMYNNGNPLLSNVTFIGNSASGLGGFGGGMFNNTSSHPTLTNVTFSGNSANYGGGIFNKDSSFPTLTNITFYDNTATNDGGGMYNNTSSHPMLTNATFSGNSANYGGGDGQLFQQFNDPQHNFLGQYGIQRRRADLQHFQFSHSERQCCTGRVCGRHKHHRY